jgi:putative transposase
MHEMGLEAIYPKLKLRQRHPEHQIYQYLLRDQKVTESNQVWCRNITYLWLVSGFVYWGAIWTGSAAMC